METKKFQRKRENFVCGHCRRPARGGGYTNHCPFCLWSKHVDINPGDRREMCGGMMKPVQAEVSGGRYAILHRCVICRTTRKNKAAKNDDFETILKLSKNPH